MAEILIEGRGLSGHNLADKLADNGWDVLLSGPEYKTTRSWFVLRDRMPVDTQEMIVNKVIPTHSLDSCRFVIVDPNSGETIKDFMSNTQGQVDKHSCVMIDDKETKDIYKSKALSNGNVSVIESSIREVTSNHNGFEITFEDGTNDTVEKVVDASGTSSRLLRRLKLDSTEPLTDDALAYWIYGYRVTGKFDPDTMVFPLKDISTGRMSWISPWSEETADVLAADYCRVSDYKEKSKSGYFQETYGHFRELCENTGICRIDQEVEEIRGRTRLVPIKKAYGTENVYAVGDAAGQACPNMAEGIPPALYYSDLLAEQLNRNPNYSGRQYYQDWRYRRTFEPYELSTAFLLERLPVEQAGQNCGIYETIANCSNFDQMMRITSERRLNLSDIPTMVRLSFRNPRLINKAVRMMVKSKMSFKSKKNLQVLYGENSAK